MIFPNYSGRGPNISSFEFADITLDFCCNYVNVFFLQIIKILLPNIIFVLHGPSATSQCKTECLVVVSVLKIYRGIERHFGKVLSSTLVVLTSTVTFTQECITFTQGCMQGVLNVHMKYDLHPLSSHFATQLLWQTNGALFNILLPKPFLSTPLLAFTCTNGPILMLFCVYCT